MAFINAMKHYADFKGTAGRKDFWLYLLEYYILSIVIWLPMFFVGGYLRNIFFILQNIFGLATIVPTLAICCRRLHDTGHSAWTVFVPIYNLILYCSPSAADPYPNNKYPNDKILGIIFLIFSFMMPAFLGVVAAVAIPSYMQYVNANKAAGEKLKQDEERILKQIEEMRLEEERRYQQALNDANSEE